MTPRTAIFKILQGTTKPNTTVAGSIYLYNDDITALPYNLTIEGNLDLTNCSKLISLPDKLKIRGWLDINGCTSLSSIPNDISILNNLFVAGYNIKLSEISKKALNYILLLNQLNHNGEIYFPTPTLIRITGMLCSPTEKELHEILTKKLREIL